MHHTDSGSVIQPVECVPLPEGGTEVWLRREITETEQEGDEGLPPKRWEALEAHGTVAEAIGVDEASERFEELWEEFEEVTLTDAERIERVQAQAEYTALMTDTIL